MTPIRWFSAGLCAAVALWVTADSAAPQRRGIIVVPTQGEAERHEDGPKIIRRLDEVKPLPTDIPRVIGKRGRPQAAVAAMGAADAPIVLVEFSSYICQWCGYHVREVLPLLIRNFVDQGLLRYEFRDLPLPSPDNVGEDAALAARCAGEQGAFWAMHERLFAEQKQLRAGPWSDHAKAIGLDVSRFQSCFLTGVYVDDIKADVAAAHAAGARGTPSFFIGFNDLGAEDLTDLGYLKGARPYGELARYIEAMLR